MNDEIIKDILSENLKHISENDFNEKIIQQLDLSNKREKLVLFNPKSIMIGFIIISILVLGINLNIIEKLSLQTIIIGVFICISPIYFIMFNKIYQLTTPKI